MSVGRGARGGACREARVGQSSCRLEGVVKGLRWWFSVPSRGFSFVCLAFPSSCVLCFLLTFPMHQPFGNRHYGRRQYCESRGGWGAKENSLGFAALNTCHALGDPQLKLAPFCLPSKGLYEGFTPKGM